MIYARQSKDPASRAVGIGFVILLHAGLLYALLTGLGKGVVEKFAPPMVMTIVETVKPPEPEPKVQLPPPTRPAAAVLPQVVIPDPVVERTDTEGIRAQTVDTTATTAPADPGAVSTPAHIDASSCRKPEYQAALKRAGEQGAVTVGLLVGADGNVKESRVEKSSGFPRLDDATREALSLCHFVPATVNGTPVSNDQWVPLRYVWRLEDQ